MVKVIFYFYFVNIRIVVLDRKYLYYIVQLLKVKWLQKNGLIFEN